MTSLDLSKNRKLKSLSMIYMDIATIDVSNCGDEEKYVEMRVDDDVTVISGNVNVEVKSFLDFLP